MRYMINISKNFFNIPLYQYSLPAYIKYFNKNILYGLVKEV